MLICLTTTSTTSNRPPQQIKQGGRWKKQAKAEEMALAKQQQASCSNSLLLDCLAGWSTVLPFPIGQAHASTGWRKAIEVFYGKSEVAGIDNMT
uniref:Uncharacterized protein n=1 Tax=Ditylenchus dipsaci TaxID=166011 RepID=A0A915CSU2_9BILA